MWPSQAWSRDTDNINKLSPYHVYDLLEREPERDCEWFWVVHDWSLQVVVAELVEDVVEEALLVGTLYCAWNKQKK